MSRDPWSKDVQDRWFLGVLVVTFGAVLYLFSPFLYVVGAAGVVVIVTWPLFEWVNQRAGNSTHFALVDLRQRTGASYVVELPAGDPGDPLHHLLVGHAVCADRHGGDFDLGPFIGCKQRGGRRRRVAVADDDHVLDRGLRKTAKAV